MTSIWVPLHQLEPRAEAMIGAVRLDALVERDQPADQGERQRQHHEQRLGDVAGIYVDCEPKSMMAAPMRITAPPITSQRSGRAPSSSHSQPMGATT
jgi:hypothetical protein